MEHESFQQGERGKICYLNSKGGEKEKEVGETLNTGINDAASSPCCQGWPRTGGHSTRQNPACTHALQISKTLPYIYKFPGFFYLILGTTDNKSSLGYSVLCISWGARLCNIRLALSVSGAVRAHLRDDLI